MEQNVRQGDLFRDQGINRAARTTEEKVPGWGAKADRFLRQYMINHSEFMTEDVRLASEGKIPEPISKRAWGSVITRAKKEGLIVSKGYQNVQNPKAHSTPATLWAVRDYQQKTIQSNE